MDGVRQHLRRFFDGHASAEHTWNRGPASRECPHLRVAEFAPGPKTKLWAYATIGASTLRPDSPLEFVLLAPASNSRHVELTAIAAWYHRHERLGIGHTVPIGQPWLPGSACNSILVSLPYPFGPSLEWCRLAEGDVRVLWLLPITEAERQFKISAGLEALERKFDKSLKYWRVDRPSVVPPGTK